MVLETAIGFIGDYVMTILCKEDEANLNLICRWEGSFEIERDSKRRKLSF
jgi:hypothetical protein